MPTTVAFRRQFTILDRQVAKCSISPKVVIPARTGGLVGKKIRREVNLAAALRAAKTAAKPSEASADVLHHRRQMVADLCRLLGPDEQGKRRDIPVDRPAGPPAAQLPNLSPRMRQTLDRLLIGDSEKQIAAHLGVSKHTIHVYVKALYKGFDVCSRGELLAKFVTPATFSSPR